MVEMYRKMCAAGLRSRMILQVHDEIVIDLYRPEQEQVAQIVVEAMERAAKLSVPLTVDYGVGENWLEAH
jgi:DNA polymerase-1